MEEFLSIIRPSFAMFQPTSPILRSSNGVAHGFVPYRQALSPALSNEGLGLSAADQSDNASKENEMVVYPFRLLAASPLCMYLVFLLHSSLCSNIRISSASPVLRARNPFPRHQPFEGQVSAFIAQRSSSSTPSPASATLSPSAIPLPSPTPDEMDQELS